MEFLPDVNETNVAINDDSGGGKAANDVSGLNKRAGSSNLHSPQKRQSSEATTTMQQYGSSAGLKRGMSQQMYGAGGVGVAAG